MDEDKNETPVEADDETSGRDRATESEPTRSGHSTAATHAERNSEDESPS